MSTKQNIFWQYFEISFLYLRRKTILLDLTDYFLRAFSKFENLT